jgi:hypothetical protein
MPVSDHQWPWAETDNLADWVAVLAGLAEEATREAIGPDAEHRADDALHVLRTKADRAGISLGDDVYAAARTQFLADFLG